MLGKRKNRSKASKDSLPSPDEKKSKDEGKAHSTASETDEVFEALEMAEGVGSKLEAVLKKLEKLDTIESRLSQMHTTLASIEENVSRLDSDVEDLKTKSKQLGSTVNELKESIEFNEEDISDLKLENQKLQQDICELQKQLLYMETYSRRENVKFVGLLEEQVDNMNGGDEDHNGAQAKIEDTRGIIYKFLEHQLKIPNARQKIEFQRLHRLGKSKNGSSRPIIARFLRYGDKELVMDQARKHLKDTEFHVYDDIPKLLYDSRKGQMKKLQKAREKGFTAYFSKAQPDKLYVNGKYIAPGEPIE